MNPSTHFDSPETLNKMALALLALVKTHPVLNTLDRDQLLEACDEMFNLPEFFKE